MVSTTSSYTADQYATAAGQGVTLASRGISTVKEPLFPAPVVALMRVGAVAVVVVTVVSAALGMRRATSCWVEVTQLRVDGIPFDTSFSARSEGCVSIDRRDIASAVEHPKDGTVTLYLMDGRAMRFLPGDAMAFRGAVGR